jgi:hypothetical protein
MIGLFLASCTAAWAGSAAGLGVPVVGGPLSNPIHAGAAGLALNPAAALSEDAEMLLDVGMVLFNYGYTLFEPPGGGGPDSTKDGASFPVPYIAISVPVSSKVGLGLSGKVPHGRRGSGDPEASSRFHTVAGQMMLAELEAAASVQVAKTLAIGAGFRIGKVRYSSFKSMDTGATMYGLMGEDAEELIGDPFWEGTKEVTEGTGTPTAFSVGLLADFPKDIRVAAGYRSAPRAHISGTLTMVPSNDLEMALEGEIDGVFTFPPEAFLSVMVPVGSIRTAVDLGWIGWSESSQSRMLIKDPVLVSDDPVVASLMALYGLDDPTLIGDLQSVGKSGMRDIFTGGAWVEGDLRDGLVGQVGVWVSPPAVMDEYAAPGNADYWVTDFRGTLSYELLDWVTIAGNGDWLRSQQREITNSGLSLTNTGSDGPGALPSGNGLYYLNMCRLGMSLLFTI